LSHPLVKATIKLLNQNKKVKLLNRPKCTLKQAMTEQDKYKSLQRVNWDSVECRRVFNNISKPWYGYHAMTNNLNRER
jgi:hypothetical protein